MIVRNNASVVFDPITVIFDIIMVGGNGQQMKEISTQRFDPDHTVTPLVLEPNLQLTDPMNVMQDGDYSTSLFNVRWYLDEENASHRILTDAHNTVSDKGVLTWGTNTEPETSHTLICVAQFLDPRRNEVLTFRKMVALGCNAVSTSQLTLVLDAPLRCPIYPFRTNYFRPIKATMYNGADVVQGASCTWYVTDEHHPASTLDPRFPNIIGSLIVVDTRYVGKLMLECRATHPVTGEVVAARTKLHRWYGQYLEKIDLPKGSAIRPETTEVEALVTVSTNRLGDIENPERYFDIALAWRKELPGEKWKVFHHGAHKTIPVQDVLPKYGVRTEFAAQVRELSELRRCRIGQDIIKMNGKEVYMRVPTIASDFD